MNKLFLLFFIFLISISCNQQSGKKDATEVVDKLIQSSDIRVRDPYILAHEDSKTYYLYASIENRTQDEKGTKGVEVYSSKDLQNWTNPQVVFEVPEDFWATKWVWAPEVHRYRDKYYLFTTFTSHDTLDNPPAVVPTDDWPPYYLRGSQILVSDSPVGPFIPFKNAPHTPVELMTLDGTLWEEDGQPYMVYCHEWVQIKDGTMDLVELTDDLSGIKAESQLLFKASSAPWAKAVANENGYITDGCFLYRTKSDKLLMIWSSFGDSGYTIGIVASESGSVKGPWKHQETTLFERDGGHGMIFKTFKGQLVIVLHQPNKTPNEKMQLYKLKDVGETLELDGKLF